MLTSNLLDVRRDGLSAFTVDDLRGWTSGFISIRIGKVLQLSSARVHGQHLHSNEVSMALRPRPAAAEKAVACDCSGNKAHARMPSAHLKLQVAHDQPFGCGHETQLVTLKLNDQNRAEATTS